MRAPPLLVLLLASLFANWSTPVLAAADPAAANRPVIRTQDQLPRFAYAIAAPLPSALLSDEAAFDKLAAQVRKDGESLLRDYDIQDTSTRLAITTTLLHLAMLRRDHEAARGYIAAIRSLQPKAADKLTFGLRQQAAIAATQAGADETARKAAFRTSLSDALASLPWAAAETQVKRWKAAAEIVTANFLLGQIQSELDPGFKASGRLDWQGADSLILNRMVDQRLLPYADELIASIDRYVAVHDVAKADIWAARAVSLEGRPALTPVVIGLWDSGTDIALFKDRLYTNPREVPDNGRDDDGNGFVDDLHGIAYDLYAHAKVPELLHPLSASDRRREPQLRALYKGFNDLQADIDSPEAQALRQRMAALKPEEAGPVMEDSAMYMFYAHGTHVAGIASEGNPAARLLVVRFDEPYQLKPPPVTREVASDIARHYREVIAYFRAHQVRVVNMSWILEPRWVESTLEAHGLGGSTEQRKVEAAALFKVMADALTGAIKDAPGILFVPGAGNSGDDVGFVQAVPAGIELPNVLTVGGVDRAGDEVAFTSYGERVRIHANGYEVDSVVPGGERQAWSGTSMSAPQVVNLAAKLFALDPTLTPEQVIGLILKGADRSGDGRRTLVNPKRSVELWASGKPAASSRN